MAHRRHDENTLSLRLPPFVIGWRLARDALAFWLGIRVFLTLVSWSSASPSPLLPTARISAVVVVLVVILCAVQVRRLRETALLRNLGVSLSAQLAWSSAVAMTIELIARWIIGTLGGGQP